MRREMPAPAGIILGTEEREGRAHAASVICDATEARTAMLQMPGNVFWWMTGNHA